MDPDLCPKNRQRPTGPPRAPPPGLLPSSAERPDAIRSRIARATGQCVLTASRKVGKSLNPSATPGMHGSSETRESRSRVGSPSLVRDFYGVLLAMELPGRA